MTGFIRRFLPGLLGLPLLIVMSGCGDKQQTPETPAVSTPPAIAATDDKQEAAPGSEPANGVAADEETVASVNGTAISRRAYNREVALEKEFAQAMKQREPQAPEGAPIKEETFEKDSLTTLINVELAYQESQRLKMNPSVEEIEQTLSLMKANYATESEFEAALLQNTMTIDELKEQIRRSLAIKMWQEQEFVDKMSVSDEEAEKLYQDKPELFVRPESIMVSHILINWPDEGDRKTVKEEARRKITEIRELAAAANADFSLLAKKFSADPTVQDNGGNLGWITKGVTVEPFEAAAFALEEPGRLSEIVESPFGFHIIKLEEKQPAGRESFEEVKEWLKVGLAEEKIEKAVQERLAALKNQADVKITAPELAEMMAAVSEAEPKQP